MYLRSGAHEEAIEQFRRAVELTEDAQQPRAEFQYHLGLALTASGRTEQAAVAFDQALALDPAFAKAADARRQLKLPARAQTAQNPS